MTHNRTKLYLFLFIACLAGYVWIYFGAIASLSEMKSVEVCLIKHTTNIPCPSCGSSRAVLALIHGNFTEAFYLNPLGYLVAGMMIIIPLWIGLDVCARWNSLLNFYHYMERTLKKSQYAIPLIALVIMNWIWNISKGL